MRHDRTPRRLILEQLEDRLMFDAVPDGGMLIDCPPPEQTLAQEASVDGSVATVRQPVRELVVVDPSLDDVDTLLSDLEARLTDVSAVEVVLLDPEAGIGQLSEILDRHRDLSAVHLLSHGDEGAVRIGSEWLTATSLTGVAAEVAGWGDALSSDGDILIYGCDVAGSDAGIELVESLSVLTGADVGASDDDTGSSSRGGDWNLEYAAGRVETEVIVSTEGQSAYRGLLAVGADVTLSGLNREVFLGETFDFNVTFQNTGAPGETGYGPYVDLVLETSGPDGLAGLLTQDAGDDSLDGISFVTADGYIARTHVVVFGDDDGATQYDAMGDPVSGTGTVGTVDHPFAVDAAGDPIQLIGHTGDALVVLELDFGSFPPGQAGGEMTVTARLSEDADLGSPLTIRSQAGFRFGADPLDNPTTDAPIRSDAAADTRTWVRGGTVTPKLLDLTAQNLQTGEAVTGPNYVHTYRTTARLAPGQVLTDGTFTVDLPDDVVFAGYSVTGLTSTGDNAGSLSLTSPQAGAQLVLTGVESTAALMKPVAL